MTIIEKEVISNIDITVFRVKGEVIFDHITHAISEFYKVEFTNHAIWDLADADLKNITNESIKKIILYAKEFGHLRNNGKTAFIVPSALSYGLGRMYDSMAQVLNHPVIHGVFKTYDEAISWIAKDDIKKTQDN